MTQSSALNASNRTSHVTDPAARPARGGFAANQAFIRSIDFIVRRSGLPALTRGMALRVAGHLSTRSGALTLNRPTFSGADRRSPSGHRCLRLPSKNRANAAANAATPIHRSRPSTLTAKPAMITMELADILSLVLAVIKLHCTTLGSPALARRIALHFAGHLSTRSGAAIISRLCPACAIGRRGNYFSRGQFSRTRLVE